MVAVRPGIFVRRVANPVLRAQLIANLFVNVRQRILLVHLEETAARLIRDPQKQLLPIVRFHWPAVTARRAIRITSWIAARVPARISTGIAAGISIRVAVRLPTHRDAAAAVTPLRTDLTLGKNRIHYR